MLSIDQYLNTIVWLDVILVILCAYLIVQVPRYYRLKFIVIPLLFAVVFVSIQHFTDILGRPYQSMPQGQVVIKSHRIVKQDDGIIRIEIWTVSKDGSRLYSIPYSDQIAQELAKAAERGKQGQPQIGEFKRQGDGGIRHSIEEDMKLETHPLPNLFETINKEESNQ